MEGRVVVVTGGTQGIGRAIVARFVDAGATVVAAARREPDPGQLPGEAGFAAVDVRDPASARALIDEVVRRHARLDLLVNNAGGTSFAPAAEITPESFGAIVELNLVAPFLVAQAANAVMQEQPEGGHIVNIGSAAAHRAAPGTAAYAAAKAGLMQLTRALAIEWAPKVRVNQLTPGLVRTENAERHYRGPGGLEAVEASIPLGRMADADDIAGLCLLLASPLAALVSGAELIADGGGQRPAWFETLQRVDG
jgi:NAD(P)-dependent dehydrogenase (short-subunit alcohol dehydrogenase family)